MRTIIYIDGLNLYHAIKNTGCQHLKWLDLAALSKKFAPAPRFSILSVYYFTAYATWLPTPYKHHREYVRALGAAGVIPVLGKFKEKDRECVKCGSKWKGHEEKETDVNIAICMLSDAYDNRFDAAILFSSDPT